MQVRADAAQVAPPVSGPSITADPFVALGVDVVDVARFTRMTATRGPALGGLVFTPAEIAGCRGRPERLAARLAAKEAVAKALGTGIGPVGWRDVEVLNGAGGEPVLVLRGTARTLAEARGLRSWALSLAHDAGLAVAVVVAARTPVAATGREGLS